MVRRYPAAWQHERLYRSLGLMQRIADWPVTVCGAGALGANLVETLARSGFGRLRVIDRDRVEEGNLSTQPWTRADIGAGKAVTLARQVFRSMGVEVDARAEDLQPRNAAKLLGGSAVVVDTFDNSASRAAVREACASSGTPLLHAGMSGDGCAEVLWDEDYTLPSDAGDDVCDYPLARNLVMLTVAVAAEALLAFAEDGRREGRTVTLRDLSIRAL